MSESDKPRWKFKIGKHNVIVDYEMVPILAQYTWHVLKNGKTLYAATAVRYAGKQQVLLMHRLLMGQRQGQIDHVNRNGLDNRLENLRYATASENRINTLSENKTGYRGVRQVTGGNTFFVEITKDKKKQRICGFKTALDAAKAYDKLSKELHGEFGIRNFKD